VGCAGGFFLKAAENAGWNATGIELSRHLYEFGTKELGVTIIPGTLDRTDLPEKSFDLITFWDVLEHVADPKATLLKARRLLKPGGYLLVNYPDFDSVGAKLLGRRWWFLIDVHIYYFTPTTLKKLVEGLGFRVTAQRRHYQQLRFGYLADRIAKIVPFVGRGLAKGAQGLGLKNLPITYYASQKTTLARWDPNGITK
jgi:2-polyprenyl-3-methyl-5-hydroxy-6-metoxy-1,4-benzoquinol methylase